MTMPDTPTLARRDGVELVRTGRWAISTGVWTASREDLTAAVAAISCPAIQKPIVKIGHTDKRFTPGDGEPAIGWYENLRTTDGGHTLIADQVAPAWLTDVQAAAWPNRSVEGSYNYRCGLGHRHPFVLTAVALLGVTPPGVSTLTSLNSLDDVRSLYGLAAASREPAEGEVRIVASVSSELQAAAEVHTGAMVALLPSPEDAERLAVRGGEPADELHVTLMYLGKASEIPMRIRAQLIDAVRRATTGIPLIEAHGFALSVFNPPGSASADGKDRETCIVLGMSGVDLGDVHTLVSGAVRDVAASTLLEVPRQHQPWQPHITLTYSDDLSQVAKFADRTGPVRFDRIRLAFAGERLDIPLTATDHADMPKVPNLLMPVEAAGDANLREYWLHGEGAAKIRWGTGGDFTRCVRNLRDHVRDPEGLCAEYHHEATGMWPGDRRNVHASVEEGIQAAVPRSLVERIHQAWNDSDPPEQQWIVEAAEDEVIVMDNSDRSLLRVPVTVDGDRIAFGEPQRVRTTYVLAGESMTTPDRLVFATAAESRPDVAAGIDGDAVDAHGTHNQKSHGNRYNTPGDRTSGLRNRDKSSGTRKPGRTNGNDQPSGTNPVGPTRESALGVRERVRQAGAPFNREAEQREADEVRRREGIPSDSEIDKLSRDKAGLARTAVAEAKELAELRVALRSMEARQAVYRDELGKGNESEARINAELDRLAQEITNTKGFIANQEKRLSLVVRQFKGTDRVSAAQEHPAAEPEPNTNEKEDPVSDLSEIRSRLGLADDADEPAVLAALDALKSKADTAPNPETVAASAAKQVELEKTVDMLTTQVGTLSKQIADDATAKAATVKASVIDTAIKEGKILPADKERWETDYDEAPGAVTRVLASIAPGTAVPVSASGYTGDAELAGVFSDADFERELARLDGPTAAKGA